MNILEQSERTRHRLEAISETINNSLDSHSSPRRSVGIMYEHNPEDRCPHCDSGLKRKFGFKKGKQKYQCLCCWHVYIKNE